MTEQESAGKCGCGKPVRYINLGTGEMSCNKYARCKTEKIETREEKGMRKPFWVVWEPTSGYTRVQHDSPSKANCEAERLARENPGKEFIVLMSYSGAVRKSVDRIDFDLSGAVHD
jgi:hypothetical protein